MLWTAHGEADGGLPWYVTATSRKRKIGTTTVNDGDDYRELHLVGSLKTFFAWSGE